MARERHLSIRLTPEEKQSLQDIAAREDLTLGQLVRRALRLMEASAPAAPVVPAVRRIARKEGQRQ
jgi:hypothetical protein